MFDFLSESQSCFGGFHEMAHIWGSDLELQKSPTTTHNKSQGVKTSQNGVATSPN